MKTYFVIDYKFQTGPVHTQLFDFETEQHRVESFCNELKSRGRDINIRIADETDEFRPKGN